MLKELLGDGREGKTDKRWGGELLRGLTVGGGRCKRREYAI
jgi:hypothetical protein